MKEEKSDSPERQPGELLGGKYRILRPLSKGGLARVYLIEDITTGREWALKEYLIDEADAESAFVAKKNIETEAKYLQALRIRGIPYIRDVVMEENFLVMDFFQGENLYRKLRNNGPFPKEDVRYIAARICDILKELHNNRPQIVFQDIKPANIMLKDNEVTLVDFGTLREYRDDQMRDRYVLGTPEYMPPEMSGRIKRQTDGRSDIYSLGVTIFQLLTREKPNEIRLLIHDRIKAEMERTEEESDGSPDDTMMEGLLRIAEKCTRKDPEDRFQTVEELKHALGHASEIAHEPQKRARRERIVTRSAVPALLLCTVLAASSIIWRKQMDDVTTKVLVILAALLALGILLFIFMTKISKRGEKKPVSTEYGKLVRDYDRMLADDDERLDRTNLLVKRPQKKADSVKALPRTEKEEAEENDEQTVLLKYKDQKTNTRVQIKNREIKKATEEDYENG